MNILEIQNRLKNFSQEQLVKEMQRPSGQVPQFLVLSELQRRKQMQADFAKQQSQQDQTTVAQDAVAAAGVPQGGIAQMARSMAPKTNITQNTGIASVAPQGMKSGGAVRKMQVGGSTNSYLAAKTDPAVIAYANKLGMTVDEYLTMLGQQGAATIDAQANARSERDRMKSLEPIGDGITFPTQADLDRRYMDQKYLIDTNPMKPPAGIAAVAPLRVPKPEPSERMTPLGYPTKEPTSDTSPLPPRTSISGALANDAITQVPPPSARPVVDGSIAPQYAPDTVFDPMTGAVISGGDVIGGPAPGPSTGDWFQDLIQSEATKQAVQDIRDKQAAQDIRDKQAKAPPTGPAGDPLATTPTGPAPTSTTPSGGGAGVPSAGAPSDYESELMSMLKSNERKAEQDKWLTLAQFGLQLMGANSSSLAGSIGQAGQNVIPAYQQSRDANEAERMKLLGALEESRMARQALAMRAAASAGPKPMPVGIINDLGDTMRAADKAYTEFMAMYPIPTDDTPDLYSGERVALRVRRDDATKRYYDAMSQYGVSPLAAGPLGPVDMRDK